MSLKRVWLLMLLLFLGGKTWSTSELWKDSVKVAYDRADYQVVEALLLKQVREEASAELYFNLGNAMMKQGKLGEAIWNYEQASLMNPTDEDIQHNLTIAKGQVRDQFEEIPTFSLFPLMARINHFVDVAWLGVLAYLLILSVVEVAILHKVMGFTHLTSNYWKGVLVAGMLLLTWAKVQASVLSAHQEGIVMQDGSRVLSEPNEQGKLLFQVGEGVKMTLGEVQNGYLEVVAPNGAKGWVLEEGVRELGTDQ